MARQKVTIEMSLPEGEEIRQAPELFEWVLSNKLIAESQGIECRVFVDKEELKLEPVMDLDQGFRHRKLPS